MALYPEDKRAGITGMIVGTLVLGVIVYGIVLLTNMKYANKEHGRGPEAPAAATH